MPLDPDAERRWGERHAGKERDIQADPGLAQETVFGGELDIAQAHFVASPGRNFIRDRGHGGQLEVGRGAIVEVDAGFAGGAVAPVGAVGEGVDFVMLVIGRLRIVRYVWRAGPRRPRQEGKSRRPGENSRGNAAFPRMVDAR